MKKHINPALAEVLQKQRENKIIDATGKAHMLLTLMVLHDKFGFGRVRCERYLDECGELLDSYNKGFINLKDLTDVIKDELGIEIKI